MITKGIVIALNSNNTIKVRIPLFESAGNYSHQVLDCTVCYNPGNLNGYKIDDVVWIGFENNQIEKPVVLGKLYLGDEKEATNYSFLNALKVTEKASLPFNTTIGDLDFSNISHISDELKQMKDISNQNRKYTEQVEKEIEGINQIQIIDLRS